MRTTSRTDFICYTALLALHIGLIWWLSYFPTQDGPSHLYNLVILHDLLNGGKEWGPFFTYHFRPVPNLAFEAISYPLLKIFHPLVVEKIFVSLYILLLGTSVPFFLKTFGRSPLPLAYLLFPVVFNFTLMMGFYSYIVAVPLFLFGSSLAWKNRNSSEAWKFIVFNLTGIIIFYAHLIPFIFFILFLFAMMLAEWVNFKHFSVKIIKLSLVLFPSLLNLLFYISARRGNMPTPGVSRSTLDYLFKDLSFFSTVTFTPLQMFPAYLFLNLIMIGAYMSFRHFIYCGWRFTENSKEKRTLLIYIVMLVLIYFCMPFRFGGGSYFNERFPWVILLAGLPLLFLPETESRRKFIAFTGIAVAVIFWSCNLSLLNRQSKMVREYLRGLHAGIPAGAFVMTYKTKDARWPRVDVLLHAASYYGIYDGCVDIGNYEAGVPYFPVQFVTTLPAFPPRNQIAYDPAKIRWSRYPGIGYLLGWDLERSERVNLGKMFHIFREEGRLTIWQRKSTPP